MSSQPSKASSSIFSTWKVVQVAKLHKKEVKRQKKKSRKREKLRKKEEEVDLERGKFGGSLDGRFRLPAIKEETPSIMSSVVSSRAASLASVSLESVLVEDSAVKERKPTFKSYIKEDLTIDSLYFNGKKPEEEEKRKEEEEKFNQQKYMIEQLKRRKSVKPGSDVRRKSVFTKILGEAGNDRRFSNDLFPRLEDIRNHGAREDVDEHIKEQFEEDPEMLKEMISEGKEETTSVIFYQVFIPFLIAGFDNVGAGIILDMVQHWSVFRHAPELFILVASFLGLKGNLEMTLAARLATMANMGQLDVKSERIKIASGNIALVQGQAIIVAFLASIVAISVNYFKDPDFNLPDCLLITATGLTTASVTGFAMANLMVTATVIARKLGVNPDNVSALIASIMGDISAITMLSLFARLFYKLMKPAPWLTTLVILSYLVILPFCLYVAFHNHYTKDVVGTGWVPIILAMMISSVAGFIFDLAIGLFETIAVVQPIINGVGGNLVAVQASRISTYYHLRVPMGTLPADEGDKGPGCGFKSLKTAFFGSSESSCLFLGFSSAVFCSLALSLSRFFLALFFSLPTENSLFPHLLLRSKCENGKVVIPHVHSNPHGVLYNNLPVQIRRYRNICILFDLLHVRGCDPSLISSGHCSHSSAFVVEEKNQS